MSSINPPVRSVGQNKTDSKVNSNSARRKLLLPLLDYRQDESLLGMIFRALAENHTSRIGTVFQKIGISTLRPETLPILHKSAAEAIAHLLGVPLNDIIDRFYTEIAHKCGDLRNISFFHTSIPAAFREPLSRRSAPAALASHGRHLAIWDLRPFNFDPATMQILVDRCQNPDCGKQLTWRRANGVCYCGYCGADIRDFISEYVSLKYQSACRFAAGLVNPDPTERRLSYTQLPKLLAGYDSGFLLDLAVRLAFIHEPKTVGVGAERSHVAVTSGHFTEVDLARGARMVLGWPNSLYHLIDRLRGESHTRYGSYGVTKEIGPVAAFMANPNIPDAMRTLVKSEVDRYYAGRDDVVLRASDHRANGRAVGYYTMQQTAEMRHSAKNGQASA